MTMTGNMVEYLGSDRQRATKLRDVCPFYTDEKKVVVVVGI